jgi:hypothetical protein
VLDEQRLEMVNPKGRVGSHEFDWLRREQHNDRFHGWPARAGLDGDNSIAEARSNLDGAFALQLSEGLAQGFPADL